MTKGKGKKAARRKLRQGSAERHPQLRPGFYWHGHWQEPVKPPRRDAAGDESVSKAAAAFAEELEHFLDSAPVGEDRWMGEPVLSWLFKQEHGGIVRCRNRAVLQLSVKSERLYRYKFSRVESAPDGWYELTAYLRRPARVNAHDPKLLKVRRRRHRGGSGRSIGIDSVA